MASADANGRALWAEVEKLIETYVVPELTPGTFTNYELFALTGEDARAAVKHKPADSELNPSLLEWAGNAFLFQMGFFRWDGELCCELKIDNKTRELTNLEIYDLVVERMEHMGLRVWSK